jgi:hypothetical protein
MRRIVRTAFALLLAVATATGAFAEEADLVALFERAPLASLPTLGTDANEKQAKALIATSKLTVADFEEIGSFRDYFRKCDAIAQPDTRTVYNTVSQFVLIVAETRPRTDLANAEYLTRAKRGDAYLAVVGGQEAAASHEGLEAKKRHCAAIAARYPSYFDASE